MENQTAYYAPVQPEVMVRTKPQIVERIKCRESTLRSGAAESCGTDKTADRYRCKDQVQREHIRQGSDVGIYSGCCNCYYYLSRTVWNPGLFHWHTFALMMTAEQI